MRYSQKGYGAIEILCVIVVLGAVAAASWYFMVRNNRQPATSTAVRQTAETKLYTDSSKLYSVSHPAAWPAKEAADCCEEARDYSQISKGVTFAPASKAGIHGYGLRIQADKTTSLAQSIEQNWKDNRHEPEPKVINGYTAKYAKVAFKGDAENYIDHNYLITHNGASVFMTFRERYYHQYPAEDWSAAPDLDAFNAILNSVKFLN